MITVITEILTKYYAQEGIRMRIVENAEQTKIKNSLVYDIIREDRAIHTFELAEMVDAYRHGEISSSMIAAEIINCLIDTIEDELQR